MAEPTPCPDGRGCDGKGLATEPHSCPFQKEINDDMNPEYCRCCEDCEQECIDGI
jgi:hypothetical protein